LRAGISLESGVEAEPTELSPQRQDAIHRALLTGLLANVGMRSDGNEYAGVRGKKFHLFPGSSLFRRRPQWVMAGELVETTRVYAHNVAAVHPLWIERAAAHLVKRTWSDPHWRPDIGRVLAYEKVTLHGLTLIARRKVHYGPIDPKLSREIFIHHALVLGDYETIAPYFAHNTKLVRQVQDLEAKSRRRDVLVDPNARFAFYDARIPQRIYTADEFEKWRRHAEKPNPRLLLMSRQDLMLHPALGVTSELYPDTINANGIQFPLEYRFEPGDRADGITVTIPLSALNQLSAEPFNWLVPGFRFDMFVALVRTLPKALRVKFVPVPDVAGGAASELRPSDGPVLEALAHHLGKISGEPVHGEDFHPGVMPEYLRMNYRIVDTTGKEIALGRDLGRIRRQLGLQARASFAANPPPQWHRDGLARWDFGDLPERVEITHDGMTLNGYPALIDAGNSVSLRLLDTPDAAAEGSRAGLRRLFMLQLREEFRYLERTIPNLESLCLYYATIGRCDDLNDDLVLAIADRALFDDVPPEIRTRDEFAARAEAGWRRLADASSETRDLIAQILESYHELDIALSGEFPPLWSDSIRDMRDQLSRLIYRGFVVGTPFERLRNLPRYLQGIIIRLKRLANAGLTRDAQAMAETRPLWDRYKREEAAAREAGVRSPLLDQVRWLIEELRVSLFAQELKTTTPVSVQRIQKLWETVRR
jgi:ATP-dependent helicase HrpA